MIYSLIWHERALKDLKRIDKEKAWQIVDRMKTYVVNNPESVGKPLKGIFKGMFRYRLGDYRIIYTIDNTEKKIEVLVIDHRKQVYKKK